MYLIYCLNLFDCTFILQDHLLLKTNYVDSLEVIPRRFLIRCNPHTTGSKRICSVFADTEDEMR